MRKIDILKQYNWIVTFVFVSTSVYMVSNIATDYIRTKLETAPHSFTSKGKRRRSVGVKKSLDFYSVIQKRNIFNSSPIAEKVATVKNPIPKTPPVSNEPFKTSLNLRLLGTIVWGREKSRAIIETVANKKQDLYKVSDVIEGAEIVDIMRNKVLLNNGDRIETLLAFEKNRKGEFDKPYIPSRRYRKGNREVVKNIGKNRYELTRKDLNDSFKNLSKFTNQAMLRPHYVNGKPAGYRVDRIKRNSLVEQVGLKNGDVIKNVNGIVIQSMEEVFQAYSQLKNQPEVKLQVERNGRQESFSYNIR